MTVSVYLAPTFGVGYQSFTIGGMPNIGGKLYTYAAGGTTPLATYTTSAGSVQNANPIVMGADGRPPNEIWLVAGSAYRFDLKDSLDNLIASYDNISIASTAMQFTQAGTGAVATTVQAKLRESASVLDFGADPTGVSDSSTAFQNALTAAKRVYVPAGTYLISSRVQIGPSNMAYLYGDGIQSIIHSTCTGDTFHIGATPGSTAAGIIAGGAIKNMQIQLYGTAAVGIRMLQTSATQIYDVVIYSYAARPNTQIGIILDGGGGSSYYNQFLGCNVQGTDIGYKFTSAGAGVVTSNTFVNCSALTYLDNTNSIGFEFLTGNGQDSIFLGGNLEDCIKGHAWSASGTRTQGLTLLGVRFEANTTDIDCGSNHTSFRNTVIGYGNIGASSGTSIANDYQGSDNYFLLSNNFAGKSQAGTFTATLTGCTTAPTYAISYVNNGNSQVTLTMAGVDIGGTSNSVSKTLTGLPASLTPSSNKRVLCLAQDNGGAYVVAAAVVRSSGVIEFSANANDGAFTAAGTFGVRGINMTYTLS